MAANKDWKDQVNEQLSDLRRRLTQLESAAKPATKATAKAPESK